MKYACSNSKISSFNVRRFKKDTQDTIFIIFPLLILIGELLLAKFPDQSIIFISDLMIIFYFEKKNNCYFKALCVK